MPSGVYVRTKRVQRGTLEERFWPKVICDLATGCWLWTGALMSKGYGSFAFGPPRGHTELAHRMAWFLTYGEWPPEWALHTCDVRRCVRPDHLFDGDNQANMADMWAKGRGVLPKRQPTLAERARGERNGEARASDAIVREVRKRYAAGGASQEDLAHEFDLGQSTISRIVRRESWAHVS